MIAGGFVDIKCDSHTTYDICHYSDQEAPMNLAAIGYLSINFVGSFQGHGA